jgi:hypothetical protein
LTPTGESDHYQIVASARLELRVERLDPPMEGNDLLLGVGETQFIEATVVAENCRECNANIHFDESHFEIVEGSRPVDLGSGTFTRNLAWRLRARGPGDKLSIEISVSEGGARQLATLPVRIYSMPKMED